LLVPRGTKFEKLRFKIPSNKLIQQFIKK